MTAAIRPLRILVSPDYDWLQSTVKTWADMMVGFLIAAVGVAVMAGMSVAANARFHDRRQLPMQWSLSGRVNWSAPRRIALAFTPTLAAIILFGAAIALAGEPYRLWIVASIAMAFVAAHLLHLGLIARQAAI